MTNVQRWATAGPMLAGAAAAVGACCAGPLVLVLLGVGGAWGSRLVALSPLQPYFVALAAASFAFAFHHRDQIARPSLRPGGRRLVRHRRRYPGRHARCHEDGLSRVPDHGYKGAGESLGRDPVKVDFASHSAKVAFDPAKASPEALTKATADAGYPSSISKVQLP